MSFQDSSAERPFDRKEAAKRLGVSLVTIDRELARKRLPHFRVGRRVLFTDELLKTYITQNTMNSESIEDITVGGLAKEEK